MGGGPGAPSAKKKGGIGIPSDIKGSLATILLAETLTFQRILRNKLGQISCWEIHQQLMTLIYKAMQYNAAI